MRDFESLLPPASLPSVDQENAKMPGLVTLLNAVFLGIELVTAVPNPQNSESSPTLTLSTAVASPSNPTSPLPSQVPLPPTQPWCPSQIFCPGQVSPTRSQWRSRLEPNVHDRPNCSSSKPSTSLSCTPTRRHSLINPPTNHPVRSCQISPL